MKCFDLSHFCKAGDLKIKLNINRSGYKISDLYPFRIWFGITFELYSFIFLLRIQRAIKNYNKTNEIHGIIR